jgi:hypothetical protein
MELRQLSYFVAVAEERNFTRAAERIPIAQPAISQQIRRLEAELGERLFLFLCDRRGIRLTPAGQARLPHARSALQAADGGREAVAALGDDVGCHRQGLGPGGQLAGVPGAGPGQEGTAAGTVGVPPQRPGALAVLDGGGCDSHVQDQAGGVHGDVAVAAVDLLGVIPAPAGLGADGAHRRGGR